MLRSPTRILIVSILVLVSGCAAKTLQPTSIALRYQSTEEPSATPAVQTCAALADLKIEDTRTMQEPGKRTLEDRPEVAQPIYLAPADPMPWVKRGVDTHFKRAGLLTNVAGKPTGRMKLEQLSLSEEVYVRATYDGRVTLSMDLISPDTGRACWSARVTGYAQNYGYAGSDANYNETFNQALDKALIQLLGTSEFSANLCGKCGS
jgi:hypothetical protein